MVILLNTYKAQGTLLSTYAFFIDFLHWTYKLGIILFLLDNDGNPVSETSSLAQVFTDSKKQLLVSHPRPVFLQQSMPNYSAFLSLCSIWKIKYREEQARSQWELSERLVVHPWVLDIFISFLSSWKLLQKQFEPFLPFSAVWYSFPWFSMYGTLRNTLGEERGKLRVF